MKEYEYTIEEQAELFLESQQNNSEAYGKLFQSCIGSIMRSLSYPHDFERYFSKLELEHEIYIRSASAITSVKSFEKYNAWLYKIAKNLMTDIIRKHKSQLSHETAWNDTVSDQVEAQNHAKRNSTTVHDYILDLNDCINLLSEKEASLIRSVDEQNYTFEEIAQRDDVSKSTVYKNYKKAKRRLKLIMRRKRLLALFVFLGNGFDIGGSPVPAASASLNLKILLTAMKTIALPLFWVTTVLTLFGKAVVKKVEQTRQPAVRYWYLRQIILAHFGMMLTPLFIVGGVQFLAGTMPETWEKDVKTIHSIYVTLASVAVIILAFVISSFLGYSRIVKQNREYITHNRVTKKSTILLFLTGFIVSTFSVLFFVCYFVFGFYTYPHQSINFLIRHNLFHAFQVFMIYMGYHLLISFSILKMLKDPDCSQPLEKSRSIDDTAKLYLILGFIALTTFTPLVNFLFCGFHLLPLLLFVSFSLNWIILIEWNRKTKCHVSYFVGSFCVQFAILFSIRLLQGSF